MTRSPYRTGNSPLHAGAILLWIAVAMAPLAGCHYTTHKDRWSDLYDQALAAGRRRDWDTELQRLRDAQNEAERWNDAEARLKTYEAQAQTYHRLSTFQQEAEPILEVISYWRDKSPDGSEVAIQQARLAAATSKAPQSQEALRDLNRAYKTFNAKPRDNAASADFYHYAADAENMLGASKRAIEHIKKAIAFGTKAWGKDDPRVLDDYELLADFYRDTNQYALAEKVLKDVLDRRKKVFYALDRSIHHTMVNLQSVLDQENKASESAQMHNTIAQFESCWNPPVPEGLRDAAQHPVRGYELLDEPKHDIPDPEFHISDKAKTLKD